METLNRAGTSAPGRGNRDLATLFGVGAIGRLSDAELLARFVRREDAESSEAAFAMLVDRHGPMVLGVCRRMLGDFHDAADAFQAVFLVLARKAPSVRVEDSLGRWLHGVSVRVARRARAVARAERERIRAFDGFDPPAPEAASPACRDDLRAAIDEEIARLPARYRSAAVLCYLEGLTQEQAARRLRCPVGTVHSRLHRARERLRPALSRRGLAPSSMAMALVTATAKADVPSALAGSAARLAGGAPIGTVPAAVALLARSTIRRMSMIQYLQAGAIVMTMGITATGAVGLAAGRGDDEKAAAPAAARPGTQAAKTETPTAKPAAPDARPGPSLAEQFERIRAEYEAQQDALSKALDQVQTPQEQNRVYGTMMPDDVAFCRRMIALAMTAPADPIARDALVWVLDKPGRPDYGPYGDEFGRAAELLVRHHGDDPEAVRVVLGLNNAQTFHRDALLLGLYEHAKNREAAGMARLALARYLELKAERAAGLRKLKEIPRKIKIMGIIGDDGKPYDKEVDMPAEEYAYELHLRQCDAEFLHAEAERLYQEVIDRYGDVPHITTQFRRVQALAKQANPIWNGRPLTADELQHLKDMATRKRTLAQAAEARLDEMHNLTEGQPAPEIVSLDMDGTPRKLSDYRGKVVALVFWGTWCGPCMRQVPIERELVKRLAGKPFAMLGVDCDRDIPGAKKVMKDEGITWPNWNDGEPGEGPIVKKYHVQGYPTVFVIDAQGKIRHKNAVGSTLDKLVEDMLKEMEAGKTAR
ncbi:MAG: sigma-70 family RNA polymerase sigma factor [Isosphaeraceae bacterium]